jgi:hypothetical protein
VEHDPIKHYLLEVVESQVQQWLQTLLPTKPDLWYRYISQELSQIEYQAEQTALSHLNQLTLFHLRPLLRECLGKITLASVEAISWRNFSVASWLSQQFRWGLDGQNWQDWQMLQAIMDSSDQMYDLGETCLVCARWWWKPSYCPNLAKVQTPQAIESDSPQKSWYTVTVKDLDQYLEDLITAHYREHGILSAGDFEILYHQLGVVEIDRDPPHTLLAIDLVPTQEGLPLHLLQFTDPNTNLIHLVRLPPHLCTIGGAVFWWHWQLHIGYRT